MATTKRKPSKKKAETSAPKVAVRTKEKPVHRLVAQTFTAKTYATMRRLPGGAAKALEMEAGDRAHREEEQWRQMWKTICSRPA